MTEKWNRTFAAAGILVSTTTFVVIVCWLHVVRPDLDPVRSGVSRYAAGDHGYAVTASFVMLSLAILIAASRFTGPYRHALWASSAGLLLVVLLPVRSSGLGRVEYTLHQVGGAVFFAAATIGVQAIPRKLRARQAPAPLQLTAHVSAVAAAIALALFFASVAVRGSSLDAALGVFQRVCFAAICVALVALGFDMLRETPHARDLQANR